ncbi:Protein frg1 [Golovinomyces cichoracearum]|uniref:Protein frg1 n=1 Tax=Golovinomyces cichoracearum TaxID=62708 RepID=A0A420HJ69_9PEZI|nr:Protein frg1 [Golovinomyces cichoracearum]
MVKALTFKGDKKVKKRKRSDKHEDGDNRDTNEGQVAKIAEADAGTDDDSWISAEATGDILGPVVIVLPSETCSCIACDINGKVFASTVENITDGNPMTVEPHEVRQVWVANRVAGTETFSLKGHNGKYLSCDKFGILSCCAEAVSPLESFYIIPTTSTAGTFQIQTLRETYLAIKPRNTSNKADSTPEIRGDSEEITFNTTLRIRMQARFKPKYKASKQEKAREKISRKEIEEAVGRRLNDDEVKKLKRARKEGNYRETLLQIKVKNKHDKYS